MFGQNGNGHHQMQLERTYPSNAQEWVCPSCDRRLMIQWQPKFKIVVLETGDDSVEHSGSTAGMHMNTPYVEENIEADMPEDLRNALEEWLNSKNFDD